MGKRENYIDWETEFMSLAFCISARSKDNHPVGCIAVNSDNKIISLGYNGFPIGCSDDKYCWDKSDPNDNKYMYVIHAEENMIANTQQSLKNAIIYSTLSPCYHCIKLLIQCGVKEVIYFESYDTEEEKFKKAGYRMSIDGKLKIKKFTGDFSIIKQIKKGLRLPD